MEERYKCLTFDSHFFSLNSKEGMVKNVSPLTLELPCGVEDYPWVDEEVLGI